MNIIEINKFSTRIFKSILKLLPQLDPNVDMPGENHFKKILKSERTHLFIAETDNKEIVGMLTIGTYDIPSGTKFWIEDVVVDESQRGKGFGEELIHLAIDFSKKNGAKSIELTSRPTRIAANELYKKCGFVLRDTNVYRYNLL
jgi:ribosomal protein S18 acetylase RimI-like enzyme